MFLQQQRQNQFEPEWLVDIGCPIPPPQQHDIASAQPREALFVECDRVIAGRWVARENDRALRGAFDNAVGQQKSAILHADHRRHRRLEMGQIVPFEFDPAHMKADVADNRGKLAVRHIVVIQRISAPKFLFRRFNAKLSCQPRESGQEMARRDPVFDFHMFPKRPRLELKQRFGLAETVHLGDT